MPRPDTSIPAGRDVPADPDVLGLVPPARRGSALAVAAVVVAALVAGWTSTALRPTVVAADGGAGGAARDLGDGRSVVGVDLEPGGVGTLTVTGVDDVPGARVLGAWVAPVDRTGYAPAGFFDPDDPAPVPGRPVGDASPLPATVPVGQDAQLVVLWDVTSCEAAQVVGVEGPVVRLRTVVGPVAEHLSVIAELGFSLECDG